LREHVVRNLGTKALALGLAIVLYLHVSTSQEREVQLDVPLELQAVPAGLTWSGDLPSAARVRFRGVGIDLLKLRGRLGSVRARIDVSEAGPGLYQRHLAARDVSISQDLRVSPVEVIEPRSISLRFDRQGSRRLPVEARLEGRVPPGFIVHRRVVSAPDSVVVDGPAAVLDSMHAVPCGPIDITGQTDMLTRRVPLRVPSGCLARPPEATVRVNVERVAARVFSALPVEVLRSRDVRLRRVLPATGTVQISGPASVVEAMAPEELRVSIDARGLPPGGVYSLMASVELRRPDSAGLVAVEPVRPEKFEVELE
jgi:YbbR domain-containing protein